MSEKSTVKEMIREAVESHDGRATHKEIRQHIQKEYGDVNPNTIWGQTIACTVNIPSRVHQPINKKPRRYDPNHDLFYLPERGVIELYRPKIHGMWEIREDEFGRLVVAREGTNETEELLKENVTFLFALEKHLRDFIVKHIDSLALHDSRLSLYEPETQENTEFRVDFKSGRHGWIDILAIDENKIPVVIELKLSSGPDKAVTQLLDYMSWVRDHIENGQNVRGIILANKITDKIRSAVSWLSGRVTLVEYDLDFKIKRVQPY